MDVLVARPQDRCQTAGRTLILSERAIKTIGGAFLIMRPGDTIGGYGAVRNMGGALDVVDVVAVPGQSTYVDCRQASAALRNELQDSCNLPANLVWYMGDKPLNVSEACRKATLQNAGAEYYMLCVDDGGSAEAWVVTAANGGVEINDLHVRWEYGSLMGLANEAKRTDLNEPFVSPIQSIELTKENLAALDEPKEYPLPIYDSAHVERYNSAWSTLPPAKTSFGGGPIVSGETAYGWRFALLSCADKTVTAELLLERYSIAAFALRKAMIEECLDIPDVTETHRAAAVAILSHHHGNSGVPYSVIITSANKFNVWLYVYDHSHSTSDIVLQMLTRAYYAVRQDMLQYGMSDIRLHLMDRKLERKEFGPTAKYPPFA